MFQGRHLYTIDSKGRISIPAKFREILAEKYDERVVVTNWFTESFRYLIAYPCEEWKRAKERMEAQSQGKKSARDFRRYFISAAVELPIDKLGRILIPPTLRSYAQLEKDVIFAGVDNTFEVWNAERFMEKISRIEEDPEGMAETAAAMGL
jgi:MraZ protein